MSKALRITSVLVAVCVVVLVVLPVVFGSGTDEQVQQTLDAPSVVESFRANAGSVKSSDEDSPLVKQAQAFALYLNPPPPPKPPVRTPSRSTQSSTPRPKSPVTAKFSLLGTSCYPLRPEMSLALIDEPGKGLRWVRQSSEVGHLIIEQVKDGVIVVRDGQRTFELVVERPKKVSLLKGERTYVPETELEKPSLSSSSKPVSRTVKAPTRRVAVRRPVGRSATKIAQTSVESPELSPEDMEWVERFMSETKDITDDEEWLKKAEELMREMDDGGRISEDEAEQLEQLGEELSDANEAEQSNDTD